MQYCHHASKIDVEWLRLKRLKPCIYRMIQNLTRRNIVVAGGGCELVPWGSILVLFCQESATT